MTIELIPNYTFRIVLLWACISTFTLNLNHVSLAVENTNREEGFNVIDELVVNNENQYKTIIYENENDNQEKRCCLL